MPGWWPVRCRIARFRVGLVVGLVALVGKLPAFGEDPRDVVFDCPCSAEWTVGESGENGELTLTFGLRSYRAVESGEMHLTTNMAELWWVGDPGRDPAASLGNVAAGAEDAGRRVAIRSARPNPGQAVSVALWEHVGRPPEGVPDPGPWTAWMVRGAWKAVEALTLWPVPGDDPDRVAFVDILTDTDGDGVGDVNERLASTSPTDEASRPRGASTIDVLALYNDGFREWLGGYPHTRIHHVMTLTRAMFADSATNVRLRTVGMAEIALGEGGSPPVADLRDLKDLHGADMSLRFHAGETALDCPSGAGGCASLLGAFSSGFWQPQADSYARMLGTASANTAAHELGHLFGLAHSARQGEAAGPFRWSRGHYIGAMWGTIMAYGRSVLGGVFADPAADCLGVPCGVPDDHMAGANAVKSLDLVRWQVAANRAAKPDSDGDGIVDPGDALPEDPSEYTDADGDGIGDNADTDDDNDGVADHEDAFPTDPDEWADADGDGIGDNVDDEVLDLDPFRDPALRAIVETAFDKAPGASITASELATLTTLEAPWGGAVRDLTGLELAGNLKVLRLNGNQVADLSPLAGLERLREALLYYNRISDLGPLAGLTALDHLDVGANPVSDLTPLTRLPRLRILRVGGQSSRVLDPSPLARLSQLQQLYADGVGISDLSLLSALRELRVLHVQNNPVADLSVLRTMSELYGVNIDGTDVADLTPLSGLDLWVLYVSDTGVSLDDVLALPNSRQIGYLRVGGLGVEDISSLSEFRRLRGLWLDDNRISDVSPLRSLAELERLDLSYNRVSDLSPLGRLKELYWLRLRTNQVSDLSPLRSLSGLRELDLHDNDVSNIGPLVRREVWDLAVGAPRLRLDDNPLDRESVREHVPRLKAWGVAVRSADSPTVTIADPALHAVVAQAVARGDLVEDPITEETIGRLTHLHALNVGVSDLAGLEAASELSMVFLGSNAVSDLTPLAKLPKLDGLDLSDNRISDLSPLVANTALGEGDWITLHANPLSEESLNEHVPALLKRGVIVGLDSVRLRIPWRGGTVAFETAGYFAARVGEGAQFAVSVLDPDAATASVTEGVLRVTPGKVGRDTTVTVTATGTDGTSATLAFLVSFAGPPRPVAAVPATDLASSGDSIDIALDGLFAGDGALTFTARSSDPGLVSVKVAGGVLTIRFVAEDGAEGSATITVTATDAGGLSGRLTFDVTVGYEPTSLLRGWRRAWMEEMYRDADMDD